MNRFLIQWAKQGRFRVLKFEKKIVKLNQEFETIPATKHILGKL